MAAAVTTATTEACASARGVTAGLAAVVITTEAAGARAGLAAGLIESARGLSVPVERRVAPAGIIVNAAVSAGTAAPSFAARAFTVHVVSDTAFAAAAVVIVAVVKGIAARVVTVVVKNYGAAAPAYAPVAPTPSEAAVESDAEADSSPIKRRAAPPDTWVGVPTRPSGYGIPVHQPWIISGDIDHVGLSRLDDDVRVLGLHGLLRCVLQVAGLLGFLAHHLNRVHYTLFLVVISVTQR